MSWRRSLDEEIQDANLRTGRPAVLTKTPNQVKLVVAKAGPVAHALQAAVSTGEVEPQRRRLAWRARRGGYRQPWRSYHRRRPAGFSHLTTGPSLALCPPFCSLRVPLLPRPPAPGRAHGHRRCRGRCRRRPEAWSEPLRRTSLQRAPPQSTSDAAAPGAPAGTPAHCSQALQAVPSDGGQQLPGPWGGRRDCPEGFRGTVLAPRTLSKV